MGVLNPKWVDGLATKGKVNTLLVYNLKFLCTLENSSPVGTMMELMNTLCTKLLSKRKLYTEHTEQVEGRGSKYLEPIQFGHGYWLPVSVQVIAVRNDIIKFLPVNLSAPYLTDYRTYMCWCHIHCQIGISITDNSVSQQIINRKCRSSICGSANLIKEYYFWT